jgi:hypothetical protein
MLATALKRGSRKRPKAVRESDAARADYATASRAVDEKTARLKSLRLAKEAEDADASQRAITPKKKK